LERLHCSLSVSGASGLSFSHNIVTNIFPIIGKFSIAFEIGLFLPNKRPRPSTNLFPLLHKDHCLVYPSWYRDMVSDIDTDLKVNKVSSCKRCLLFLRYKPEPNSLFTLVEASPAKAPVARAGRIVPVRIGTS